MARTGSELRAVAFKLDQDLSGVDFTELAFDTEWNTHMISITELEAATETLRFPTALRQADQAGSAIGETLRHDAGVELVAG